MSQPDKRAPWLPPRWVIRAAWRVHRALYGYSGGRLGLALPRPGKYGMMRLTTLGRRSGKERSAILGYYEDGPNLVTLAMNGWGEGEPAWWLNLLAHPEARVELKDSACRVRGRAAEGEERQRLWARWREFSASPDDLDAYAARRSSTTAVVVLEPGTDGPPRTAPAV
jgi:F420H(2)-dependent quinone reductase